MLNELPFGNWGANASDPGNKWEGLQPDHQRIRNCVGRLDELNILARVLAPEEITRLYEIGQPWPPPT